jgi:hypothetical protein
VELFEEEGSGNTPAAQRIRAILNFVEQLINFHSTATDLDGTSDQNGAAAANNADRKGISVVIPRDERDVSEAEKQELRRLIAKQTGSSEDDVEILFGGAE